jgi:hypothetical protein
VAQIAIAAATEVIIDHVQRACNTQLGVVVRRAGGQPVPSSLIGGVVHGALANGRGHNLFVCRRRRVYGH